MAIVISKSDIVNRALRELNILGLLTKPTADDTQIGLQKLETMVESWTNKGVHLSYIGSSNPLDPQPTDDSGISFSDLEAVSLNLAKSLAVSYGFAVPAQLMQSANETYTDLLNRSAPMQQAPNPNMPWGQGHNWRGDGCRFSQFQHTEDPLTVESDGQVGDLDV